MKKLVLFLPLRLFAMSILVGPLLVMAADSADQSGGFKKAEDKPADLDHQKTLYVVAYAHLDTQWRWAYPQVIREFIPATMRNNFKLIDQYPNYTFNFSGSRRYEFMKEYYPEDYAKVKGYVAQGRWFPCGSSVDENDAIVPGMESYVRHILYGNRFFRREFNTASEEYMLPDCFGFPACLPSLLAHCGIKEFSTQKLTWGSAVGIPFKVGIWDGVNGDSVVAALDPGSYGGEVREDLSQSNGWNVRIENTGKNYGVFADYHYYGTGDKGGAPSEESVQWVEKSIAGNGPIHIVASTADRMVKDITEAQRARLPHYQGEFLLTNHSAGALSSEAYMKRWNRKNELLANSAESAASAAFVLGGLPYPSERLYTAWDLVLGSQMHDMLPGTSLPQAYKFCWNDEVLASNQFSAVAESSAAAVISGMDTNVADGGVPIVVYNPLSTEREDVVEATIPFSGDVSKGVTVSGPDGRSVPAQIKSQADNKLTLLFLAKAPSLGYAVYEAKSGSAASNSALKVTSDSLENERYKVQLNADGDVSSIFDKKAQKELLHAPAQMAFQYENPAKYPAWNMDWEDRQKPPKGFVRGPATITIAESGPARIALRVERSAMGSKFVQDIRLGAGGAGNRVEFASDIDWNTKESSLRAAFPLSVSNPTATYDAQLGTVQRGNNDPKKFEVPQHQWIDLTAKSGDYGVSILNDCKYGSDKPDDQTLRLTLLYTPGTRAGYKDQGTQDIGHHRMIYAIEGHEGDWVKGGTTWEAARLNQPLQAFTATPHKGALGKTFSLFQTDNNQMQITAVKKAEDSDELIVRIKELSGHPLQGAQITSALPLAGAHEVNGQEMDVRPANINGGALAFDLTPYQVRAFAIKMGAPANKLTAPTSQALALHYDLDGVSPVEKLTDGSFDNTGHAYSAEQFPQKLVRDGVEFNFGSSENGKDNAVTCKGQSIDLPAGSFNRVYVLASAIEGDQTDDFKVDDKAATCTVQDWSKFIGQWDSRIWKGTLPELSYSIDNQMEGLEPGFIKAANVAWYCSHRHDAQKGNEFYQYTYIFKYGFDLAPGAKKLTLPNNGKIRVFAVSVAHEPGRGVAPAAPLFDTFGTPTLAASAPTALPAPGATFANSTTITLAHPLYFKEGNLRYTTDGTDPTLKSPLYVDGIFLNQDTVIKAREFDAQGKGGPLFLGRYAVKDVTPPSITSITSTFFLLEVEVRFSERVDPVSARQIDHYGFAPATPAIKIKSVDLSPDGMTATLHLDRVLLKGASVKLTMKDIADASPAKNKLATDGRVIDTHVYSLASAKSPDESHQDKVEGLPVAAREPWTLNFFLRCSSPPKDHVLIAGWGHALDGQTGMGRYFVNFDEGLAFWLSDEDVQTSAKLDTNRWQMLTATFDGSMVNLYKDAEKIGEGLPDLAEDEPTTGIGITDPWGKGRKFAGEIRNFRVWKSALNETSIKALRKMDMPVQ